MYPNYETEIEIETEITSSQLPIVTKILANKKTTEIIFTTVRNVAVRSRFSKQQPLRCATVK